MPTLTVKATDSGGNETVGTHTFGVAGGGDQTAFLQALIDAAPNGTEANPSEVTLPAGRWRVEGRLSVSQRQWLVIHAAGAVFYRLDRGESGLRHIGIAGSHHIWWLGGRVEGAHVEYDTGGIQGKYVTEYESQHAIGISPIGSTGTFFVDCYDITVDGFSARDVGGDFVYISPALVGPQGNRFHVMPENIIVRNVLGEKNGRQGVGCVGVRGLLVEDSTLIAKRTVVDLENVGTATVIEDVIVRRVVGIGDNGLVNGQSSHPNVNRVAIEDNAYRGGGGIRCTGLVGAHRTNWSVLRNVKPADSYVVNPGDSEGTPFWFNYTDHVRVEGNYWRIGLKRTHSREANGAVRLCGTDDVAIVNNDFRGNNQLILNHGSCNNPSTNTVTGGNTGIWEGPITPFRSYPPQFDPNGDKVWTLADFPQLNPPLLNTVGHWDNLPRGRVL